MHGAHIKHSKGCLFFLIYQVRQKDTRKKNGVAGEKVRGHQAVKYSEIHFVFLSELLFVLKKSTLHFLVCVCVQKYQVDTKLT